MKATFEKVPLTEMSSFQSKVREEEVFEFNWHYHPEFELTYIEKGRGNRLVGDQIAEFSDGDLIFIGANLPHTWSSIQLPDGSLSKAHVVQFKNDFIGQQLAMIEFKNIKSLIERSRYGISFGQAISEELKPDLIKLSRLSHIEKLLSLYAILDRLGQSQDFQLITSPHYTSSLSANIENRLDTVCRYINEHYAEAITLEEVASMSHMTKTSFCRFFKKMTGKSFSDYLNEIRVVNVCTSLMDTSLGITQIALACGFSSITHFNRTFTRKKGMSPRAFRKKYTQTGN